MLRRAGLAFVILLGLAVVSQAAPTIVVGGHLLAPNTAGQEIDIMVNSAPSQNVQGTDLNAQVADGGAPAGGSAVGPTISGNLVGPGTLFNGNNTGDTDAGSVPMGYYHSTTTASGTVTINNTNQLLVRLFIDTTGFGPGSPGDLGPGKWSLNMMNTANGPTDFGPVAAAITDGFIQIVPEPTSIVMALFAVAGLGAVVIRRRRARVKLASPK
jgi:hypothetical protein